MLGYLLVVVGGDDKMMAGVSWVLSLECSPW